MFHPTKNITTMRNLKSLMIVTLFILASCHKSNMNLGLETYHEVQEGGDIYNTVKENPFFDTNEQAVSTFSIDADGASYANVRRFILQDKQMPPIAAVRTEELLNYFQLDYDYKSSTHPISLNGEVSTCPWNEENRLIRIGIKGKPIEKQALPPANFVFLIDVSGSMGSEDKLDLLKNGFKYFVDGLSENDRVAIVTYAGAAGIALTSTSGNEKEKIKAAIDLLGSGGSTAGAEGIITAYELAQASLIPDGNNRIIIGTDGDFNVGASSQGELIKLIEAKRKLGIYLTVLGVGRGNLNEAMLEQIANNGNGNYEYIDNLEQLKKVFIYDYNKFYTVAKDVKIQVEFNPKNVKAYRLIGYENRIISQEEFTDDEKDAGEIGAGQNITALYEIIPTKISQNSSPTFKIDFRYKNPNQEQSVASFLEVYDKGHSFEEATDFMKFTAAVASFSMQLTESPYKGSSSFKDILTWLEEIELKDKHHFKAEFKSLVEAAELLNAL